MKPEELMLSVEKIENSMESFQAKAGEEIKNIGKVHADTASAIENLGEQQREVADRLLTLEQSGVSNSGEETAPTTWGKQFAESKADTNFNEGATQKARFEVQNSTLTGSDATVAPDRKAGIVGGAAQILTLENMLVSLPTSSNAIEYT
ncbi:MAG: hypothetical protein GY829_14830, partial [Gammaproteobacteria bacterium]|nr:hypothetical protein [Gammaproteobacteria bacterium]